MKQKLISIMCCTLLFIFLSACQKNYKGEYVKWSEKTNSNATELLEKNEIPYEIRNGIIYIPEDAFDKAIYCCS